MRGTLDKEIIRRTVRRHLNEVKYCYEKALATRPSLAGRIVTQFTIAPTGRVLAAVIQSSSLASPRSRLRRQRGQALGVSRSPTAAAWRWSPIRSPSRRRAIDACVA